MKIEAVKIDLDDVLVEGKRRYLVTGKYLNSGGLGDTVRFRLTNLRTNKERMSNFFAHECLLEVELNNDGAGV